LEVRLLQEQVRIPRIPAAKPKRRRGKKLVYLLLVFFIAVLAVLFFRSSLSKINEIEIAGNELVPSERIEEASGVVKGDQFFTVSTGNVEERIGKLPMIASADVTMQFPGKVRIEVKEHPRIAYQFTAEGRQEVVLADGSATTMQGLAVLADKPILSGWTDADPNKAKLCKAMAGIGSDLFYDISEIKPDPTESFPDRIKMYTRDGFEVITTVEFLPDKMQYLSGYIQNLKDKGIKNGVLSLLVVDVHTSFGTGADTTASQSDGKGTGSSENPSSNKEN
jgi:cell division protein FtsQ